MIMYQVRRADNDWSKPLPISQALNLFRNKVNDVPGPYRIRRPGADSFGPPKTLKQVMDTLRKALPKSLKNDVWTVRGKDGKAFPVRIKKVEVGLPERNPSFDISDGSPIIQRVARVAYAFDSGVRTAGIAYTRTIAGTSKWSQHSRWPRLNCKSNAIDLYFPLPQPIGNDLTRQRRLVSYLLAHADELNLHMIISEKTYWNKDYNWAPRYYSGVPHVSHTHVEGHPVQTGSPCR